MIDELIPNAPFGPDQMKKEIGKAIDGVVLSVAKALSKDFEAKEIAQIADDLAMSKEMIGPTLEMTSMVHFCSTGRVMFRTMSGETEGRKKLVLETLANAFDEAYERLAPYPGRPKRNISARVLEEISGRIMAAFPDNDNIPLKK